MNKRILFSICACIGLFALSGCDQDPMPSHFETTAAKDVHFNASENSYTFKVISSFNWNFENLPEWISASPTSGVGITEVKITIAANQGFARNITLNLQAPSIGYVWPINISQERAGSPLFVLEKYTFNTLQWVSIAPEIENDFNTQYTWELDGEIFSSEKEFRTLFTQTGTHSLKLSVENALGNHTQETQLTISDDTYIAGVTTLFEYKPAPGQHQNQGYTQLATAQKLLNGGSSLTGLGGFGGYIILGFDHVVVNKPNAPDFLVQGNAFSGFSEPGIVFVMQDTNGNGEPDDTWYELKGAFHDDPEVYRASYTVTYFRPESGLVSWEDEDGLTGTVLMTSPDRFLNWDLISPSYTVTGPHLNIPYSAAGLWGYADTSESGNLDIANAIDAAGNPVHLTGINFIKIQTASLQNMGAFGELSTEIQSIKDLNL